MPTYDFIAFYLSTKLSNLIAVFPLQKVPLFPSTIDTNNVNKAEGAAQVAGKQLL